MTSRMPSHCGLSHVTIGKRVRRAGRNMAAEMQVGPAEALVWCAEQLCTYPTGMPPCVHGQPSRGEDKCINFKRPTLGAQLFGELCGGPQAGDRSTRQNASIVSVQVEEQDGFDHPLLCHRSAAHGGSRAPSESPEGPDCQTSSRHRGYRPSSTAGNNASFASTNALAWSDPERLLEDSFRVQLERANDDAARKRVVCDYIAGMTDEYATRMFERRPPMSAW